MHWMSILAVLAVTTCKPGETGPPAQSPPPAEHGVETPVQEETEASPPETEGQEPPEDAATEEPPPEVKNDDTIRIAWECEGPEKKLSTLCAECKTETSLPAKGAYRSVKVVSNKWNGPAPGKMMNTSYALAIETEDGWYVMDHLGTDGILCGGESLFNVGFDMGTLSYQDAIPGDPPEIIMTFETWANGIHDLMIMVCSMGPSGKPSCGGPWIMTRDDPDASKSWEHHVSFLDDGRMVYKDGDEVVAGPFTLQFL